MSTSSTAIISTPSSTTMVLPTWERDVLLNDNSKIEKAYKTIWTIFTVNRFKEYLIENLKEEYELDITGELREWLLKDTSMFTEQEKNYWADNINKYFIAYVDWKMEQLGIDRDHPSFQSMTSGFGGGTIKYFVNVTERSGGYYENSDRWGILQNILESKGILHGIIFGERWIPTDKNDYDTTDLNRQPGNPVYTGTRTYTELPREQEGEYETREEVINFWRISLEDFRRSPENITGRFSAPERISKALANLTGDDVYNALIYSCYSACNILVNNKPRALRILLKNNVSDFIDVASRERYEEFRKAIFNELNYRLISGQIPGMSQRQKLIPSSMTVFGDPRDFLFTEQLVNPEAMRILINSDWENLGVKLNQDLTSFRIYEKFDNLVKIVRTVQIDNLSFNDFKNKVQSLETSFQDIRVKASGMDEYKAKTQGLESLFDNLNNKVTKLQEDKLKQDAEQTKQAAEVYKVYEKVGEIKVQFEALKKKEEELKNLISSNTENIETEKGANVSNFELIQSQGQTLKQLIQNNTNEINTNYEQLTQMIASVSRDVASLKQNNSSGGEGTSNEDLTAIKEELERIKTQLANRETFNSLLDERINEAKTEIEDKALELIAGKARKIDNLENRLITYSEEFENVKNDLLEKQTTISAAQEASKQAKEKALEVATNLGKTNKRVLALENALQEKAGYTAIQEIQSTLAENQARLNELENREPQGTNNEANLPASFNIKEGEEIFTGKFFNGYPIYVYSKYLRMKKDSMKTLVEGVRDLIDGQGWIMRRMSTGEKQLQLLSHIMKDSEVVSPFFKWVDRDNDLVIWWDNANYHITELKLIVYYTKMSDTQRENVPNFTLEDYENLITRAGTRTSGASNEEVETIKNKLQDLNRDFTELKEKVTKLEPKKPTDERIIDNWDDLVKAIQLIQSRLDLLDAPSVEDEPEN